MSGGSTPGSTPLPGAMPSFSPDPITPGGSAPGLTPGPTPESAAGAAGGSYSASPSGPPSAGGVDPQTPPGISARGQAGDSDDAAPAAANALAAGGFAGAPQQAAAQAAPAQAAAPAAPVRAPAAEIEHIVDRILVSQPGPTSSDEVRIFINRPWLPQTEVRLLRPPDGGGLQVNFVTGALAAQQALIPNLGALRARLESRLDEKVSVTLDEEEAPDAEGGDGEVANAPRVTRTIYQA